MPGGGKVGRRKMQGTKQNCADIIDGGGRVRTVNNNRAALSGPAVGDRTQSSKDHVKRAQRFTVEIPIRCRVKGESDWERGTTVNISATGILFRIKQAWKPRTALEVMLTLPVAISGEAPAEICCRGSIIRKGAAASASRPGLVAIAIERYRFSHRAGDRAARS